MSARNQPIDSLHLSSIRTVTNFPVLHESFLVLWLVLKPILICSKFDEHAHRLRYQLQYSRQYSEKRKVLGFDVNQHVILKQFTMQICAIFGPTPGSFNKPSRVFGMSEEYSSMRI